MVHATNETKRDQRIAYQRGAETDRYPGGNQADDEVDELARQARLRGDKNGRPEQTEPGNRQSQGLERRRDPSDLSLVAPTSGGAQEPRS